MIERNRIVKSFVIARAVDFITILEEDFPRLTVTSTVFTSSFPRQYDIIHRILKLLSFVYMSCRINCSVFLSMFIFF